MIYMPGIVTYETIKMFSDKKVADNVRNYLAGTLTYFGVKEVEDMAMFEEFLKLKEAKYSNRDIAMILEVKFGKSQSATYRKLREFESRLKQLEFNFD